LDAIVVAKTTFRLAGCASGAIFLLFCCSKNFVHAQLPPIWPHNAAQMKEINQLEACHSLMRLFRLEWKMGSYGVASMDCTLPTDK
jgi:hypothetical protein